MSRVSALGVRGVTYPSAGLGRVTSGAGQATSSNPGSVSTVDTVSDGFSRSELLAMNAGIDAASRTSNALSTASDAIGVIGGLLGNIQTVLHAAGSSGTDAIDSNTEQSRLDSAVTTIDAIATSSRFGGQRLLDGSFDVTTSEGAMSIPSFVSGSLGASENQGVSTAPLSSLASGGANDLASGNLATAGKIVTTAMSQVGQTQSQISQFLAANRQISSDESLDAGATASAASAMFADPSMASIAAANSSSDRVLALLG